MTTNLGPILRITEFDGDVSKAEPIAIRYDANAELKGEASEASYDEYGMRYPAVPVVIVDADYRIDSTGNPQTVLPVNYDVVPPDPDNQDFWTNEDDITSYTTSFTSNSEYIFLIVTHVYKSGATVTARKGSVALTRVSSTGYGTSGIAAHIFMGKNTGSAPITIESTQPISGLNGRVLHVGMEYEVLWHDEESSNLGGGHTFTGDKDGFLICAGASKSPYYNNVDFINATQLARIAGLGGGVTAWGPPQEIGEGWEETNGWYGHSGTSKTDVGRFALDEVIPIPAYIDAAISIELEDGVSGSITPYIANTTYSSGSTFLQRGVKRHIVVPNNQLMRDGASSWYVSGTGNVGIGNVVIRTNPSVHSGEYAIVDRANSVRMNVSANNPWTAIVACVQPVLTATAPVIDEVYSDYPIEISVGWGAKGNASHEVMEMSVNGLEWVTYYGETILEVDDTLQVRKTSVVVDGLVYTERTFTSAVYTVIAPGAGGNPPIPGPDDTEVTNPGNTEIDFPIQVENEEVALGIVGMYQGDPGNLIAEYNGELISTVRQDIDEDNKLFSAMFMAKDLTPVPGGSGFKVYMEGTTIGPAALRLSPEPMPTVVAESPWTGGGAGTGDVSKRISINPANTAPVKSAFVAKGHFEKPLLMPDGEQETVHWGYVGNSENRLTYAFGSSKVDSYNEMYLQYGVLAPEGTPNLISAAEYVLPPVEFYKAEAYLELIAGERVYNRSESVGDLSNELANLYYVETIAISNEGSGVRKVVIKFSGDLESFVTNCGVLINGLAMSGSFDGDTYTASAPTWFSLSSDEYTIELTTAPLITEIVRAGVNAITLTSTVSDVWTVNGNVVGSSGNWITYNFQWDLSTVKCGSVASYTAWTPKELYEGSTYTGCFFTPWIPGTIFSDRSPNNPNGPYVKYMYDMSGFGNHMRSTSDTTGWQRGTQNGLTFGLVFPESSLLGIAAMNLNSKVVSSVSAVRRGGNNTDADGNIFYTYGRPWVSSDTGTFGVFAKWQASGSFARAVCNRNVIHGVGVSNSSSTAINAIVKAQFNFASPGFAKVGLNTGGWETNSTIGAGDRTFASHSLRFGDSNPYRAGTDRFYGFFLINKIMSDEEHNKVAAFFSRRYDLGLA